MAAKKTETINENLDELDRNRLGCLEGLGRIKDILEKTLPPVFGRPAVGDLLPGVLSGKTLANLESKGEGPPCYKAGSRTFYEKDTFIPWFLQRCCRKEGRK